MARIATLCELHRPPGWLWVICARYRPCLHRAPMALAPLVIRWGSDTCPIAAAVCANTSVAASVPTATGMLSTVLMSRLD